VYNKEKLIKRIKSLGPWFHNIEVIDDVFTREINPSPGPQPIDHPFQRWHALEPHLPESMDGLKVTLVQNRILAECFST